MDSVARFVAAICGIQSGKTVVGAIWLCNEIWKAHEKGVYGDWLIAAPTAKILNQSTLPKFRGIVPSDWVQWKEGKQEFHLPWINPETNEPCKIYIRSAETPDWLEGMTLLGAWLDEAGLMASAVWTNVQGRLSKNLGRCAITTTPYASKWIKREIVDRARGGDTNYSAFSWPSLENPAFPREEYERMRKILPDLTFRRRYGGEFVTMEGLVYSDFNYDRDVVPSFEIPPTWKRFGGMDFGHDKPAACLSIAEDPDKHIYYVYKEFYRRESLLKDIANHLNIESLQWVLADPQGAQNIAELNRFYGRPEVKPADNKVEIGIERIQTLLKEGRLKFLRGRCQMTLEEIEEYHYPAYDEDKPDKAEKPVKKNDHAMDALKYAFSRQLTNLYPAASQRTGRIRERLAQRKFPERDEWTNY